MPTHDERELFELLTLEGAQAGLSWSTILRKREGYRRAFAGFDPEAVARFGAADVERLLADPGIVRNRLKVESTIANAQAVLALREAGGFAAFVWSFVGGEPRRNAPERLADVPAETAESRALSKELKRRGFRFVGPTVCYAFMQAAGLVDDHVTACFRSRRRRAAADQPGRSTLTPCASSRCCRAPPRSSASSACVHLLVGRSEECDWPPEVTALPVVSAARASTRRSCPRARSTTPCATAVADGRSLYAVDEALLRSLAPDLVADAGSLRRVRGLGRRPARAATSRRSRSTRTRSPTSPTRSRPSVARSARRGRARAGGADACRARRSCAPRAAGLPRPRVFLAEWVDPPFAPRPLAAGARRARRRRVRARPPRRALDRGRRGHEVRAARPDVLVLAPCGYDAERAAQEPFPDGVAERVVAVDASAYFARPGPRLVEGARQLAHLLHPEVFDDPGLPQVELTAADLTASRFSTATAANASPSTPVACDDERDRSAAEHDRLHEEPDRRRCVDRTLRRDERCPRAPPRRRAARSRAPSRARRPPASRRRRARRALAISSRNRTARLGPTSTASHCAGAVRLPRVGASR